MSRGSEALEQGDEAIDEEYRVNPRFIEEFEQDPSLDPALQVDERELEEAGVELDDPETMVTLDGGIDDPDGLGEATSRATSRRHEGEEGWKLDEQLVSLDESAEI